MSTVDGELTINDAAAAAAAADEMCNLSRTASSCFDLSLHFLAIGCTMSWMLCLALVKPRQCLSHGTASAILGTR